MKSRCDRCRRRIGPARYELGLCRDCEAWFEFVETWILSVAIVRLLGDPDLIEWIEQRSKAFADVIRHVF